MTVPLRRRQLAALVLLLATTMAAYAAAAPSSSPQSLLTAVRAASGGAHWRNIGEIDLHARVEVAGLRGTRLLRIAADGRFVRIDRVGLDGQARGFDGHHAWTQDEKGLVTMLDGARGRADAVSDGYVLAQGWLHPGADPATVRRLAPRSVQAHRFERLAVTPRGGTPLTLWFDADTHLLSRAGRDDQNGARQVMRFSDYHRIDGVQLPFRISIGTPAQPAQTVVRVQHADLHADVDAAALRMPHSHVDDARIVGGGHRTRVPFRDYAGLMLVQVSINGSRPLPFVIDSGGLNVLTPAAAAMLGLKGHGRQAVYGVGPGAATMTLTQVRSMQLGGAQLRRQRFYILPLPAILTDRGERRPVAGLIGYEVYRRFVARIDYDHRRLTLIEPDRFHPDAGERAVTLRFDGRTPEVTARVDGTPGLFLLDTGNAGALQLTAAFARRGKIHLRGQTRASMDLGVGGHSASRSGRVGSVQLDGYTLHGPRASISAARSGVLASVGLAGNIGHDVLSHFHVTLDYAHRRLYLAPGARFAHRSTEWGHTGLALQRADHDHLQVIAVAPDSPAARAGIVRGDRIDRLGGVAVSHLGLDGIRDRLRGRAGGTLRVHVLGASHGARELTLHYVLSD